MEGSRKNLKDMSILVLIFAALSLIKTVIFFIVGGGIGNAVVPEGMAAELYKATLIIAFVLALLTLIPQAYVGLKGMKVAREPDSSKAHINWAIVLLVLSAISLLSTIGSISGSANLLNSIIDIVNCLINVAAYFFYVKAAKEVRQGA